jgi:hypothetical protein
VLLLERARAAPRLAPVVRRVESSAALTPGGTDLCGEILVELQQQFVEPGILKQLVAQRRPPFTFDGGKERKSSRA